MRSEMEFIYKAAKYYDYTDIKKIIDFMWNHKLYYLLSTFEQYNDLRLELLFDYNKRNIKKMYTETQNVFSELNEMNIIYAVIKGAVLTNLAYGGIEYRTSTDIDILISKKNLKIIDKVLRKNGYIQGYVDRKGNICSFSREKEVYNSIYAHQTLPYVKRVDNTKDGIIMFDINTSIFWADTLAFDVDSFLEKYICEMNIFDTKVRCCNPIGNLVITCLHHYKDLNSDFLLLKNGYKMNLFFDIYYLLINNLQDINYEELKKVLDNLNIEKYVYYCFYYVNQIFQSNIINEYIKELNIKEQKILDTYGFDGMKKNWTINFEERFDYELMSHDLKTHLSVKDRKRIETLNLMMKE